MNLFLKKALQLNKLPKFQEIRIESTNNCGCRCFMCPIDQMTRKKGFMSIEDLKLILKELSYIDYDVSFQLHGHGESLLCKDLGERISLIKNTNPHFLPQITTTLAYNIDEDWFESLFKNGLHEIFVSLYGYNNETYKSVHGVDKFELVKQNLKLLSKIKNKYPDTVIFIQLDDFKDKYPLKIEENELNNLRNEFISYLKSLNFSDNEIIYWTLHNYGNSKSDLPQTKNVYPCSILWGTRKNILQIDWQLNIIPCCFDFDSKYSFGNLKEKTLKEIFCGEKRMKFLDSISKGNKLPLCVGCVANKDVPDVKTLEILKHPIITYFDNLISNKAQ